jgi:hypothetical protein
VCFIRLLPDENKMHALTGTTILLLKRIAHFDAA